MKQPWQPAKLDVILATVISLLFPLAAGFLYDKTGALLPMVLYYGLAWGIVIWRRGSSGYFNHSRTGGSFAKPPIWFYINTGIIILTLVLAYFARIQVAQPKISGMLITALVWATINASSEQLLWIYIFESWDLSSIFSGSNQAKKLKRAVGLILFTIFVGTIHTLFWVKFLHTVDAETSIGVLFVILTSLSGYLHLVVWRKSGEMLYTFIPHFLLNFFPVFWTGYSILPYLIK